MRAIILLIYLLLVRDNSPRVVQNCETDMEGLTLEEQIKIHQYEQDILQIKLKKKKSPPSQETNDSNSKSSNVINQRKRNTTSGCNPEVEFSGASSESLIILQEILTSDHNCSQEMNDQEHIFVDALAITRHVSEKDKLSIRAAFAENKEINCKNATQLIKENDYAVEKYDVKTVDGYYITMFRIESKQESQEVSEHPVVLIVHGLFGSADDWLLMGPNNSLAYEMADAGFDVWLGNLRGSRYSQRHTSKHHALQDFWEFSIDEIATHDLPAMIDYILKVTRESKLHYVGHSLGATAFFAMASAYPEHSQKVTMMFALSPMVYMHHVRSPLLRTISPKSRYYNTVHKQLGGGEFKPSKDFIRMIGGKMYENVIGIKQVASNVKCVVSGVGSAGMDRKMMPIIMKHFPTGTSVRLIKHYGQAKAAGRLRKYDYGLELNKKVYGQSEPPSYNLTNVQVPVAIYFSEEDLLAHPKDVERLHDDLPEVTDYYKVLEEHFSHMDFQFSKTAPEIINNRIIYSMKQTS